jgi:hypothetical protein
MRWFVKVWGGNLSTNQKVFSIILFTPPKNKKATNILNAGRLSFI